MSRRSGVEQRQSPGVAVARRIVGGRMRVVSVDLRVDVLAAGDDQPVQSVDDPSGDDVVDRLRQEQVATPPTC